MAYYPMLSQMLPNSGVVSPICSREVLSAVLYRLCIVWLSTTVLDHTYLLYYILLFHIDDVGFIMALLQRITSCQLQLIIQEDDLETPFQYLRACMPQWQVLRIQWQVYIIDLRLDDSTSVQLQLHYSHSWIVLIVPWEPLSLLVVSLFITQIFLEVVRRRKGVQGNHTPTFKYKI